VVTTRVTRLDGSCSFSPPNHISCLPGLLGKRILLALTSRIIKESSPTKRFTLLFIRYLDPGLKYLGLLPRNSEAILRTKFLKNREGNLSFFSLCRTGLKNLK